MVDDATYIRNIRRSAFALGLIVPSIQDFATEILTAALRAGAVDRDSVAAIRAECVSNLKNSHSTGLAIEEEAEVFGKAIDDFEKLLDQIISDGWEAS